MERMSTAFNGAGVHVTSVCADNEVGTPVADADAREIAVIRIWLAHGGANSRTSSTEELNVQ
jgi:hypothetical protein